MLALLGPVEMRTRPLAWRAWRGLLGVALIGLGLTVAAPVHAQQDTVTGATGTVEPAAEPEDDLDLETTVPFTPSSQGSFTSLEIFRIGAVVKVSNEATLERHESLRALLERELNQRVAVVPFANGNQLADAFNDGRIDLAGMSASAYAALWNRCDCVEPLVAPRGTDGATGFKVDIVVKTSSRARSVADLAGKKLAVAGPDSIAGRIVPLRALRAMGLEPERHFAEIVTTPSPVGAVRAVHEGQAEAAAVWRAVGGPRGTLADLPDAKIGSVADYVAVWTSGEIAHAPIVTRKALPLDLRSKLRHLLVTLQTADADAYDTLAGPFGGGFQPVEHGGYKQLVDLLDRRQQIKPSVEQ
jgi:phosphonate transport system substrate-binding protein